MATGSLMLAGGAAYTFSSESPLLQQKPQAYNYEFNEQATKAFSNAISTAMNNNESHTIKYGTLTLTFEVGMEEDCVLHWYYQPSPNLVVPKRSLTDDGEIAKTFLGMRNNDLIN